MKPIFLAASLLFAFSTAAFAGAGEYDNLCAMGLAIGKRIPTDCSVSETINGKTYCFGNETAKTIFMKNAEENLAKAEAAYTSKK
jgi:YHS domain-containing protein